MPTYQYKCNLNSEHTYSEVRAITAEEPDQLICNVDGCDGKLIKVFGAPAINFKGGGWSTKESWR